MKMQCKLRKSASGNKTKVVWSTGYVVYRAHVCRVGRHELGQVPSAYLSAPCLHLHDDHLQLLHNSNHPNLSAQPACTFTSTTAPCKDCDSIQGFFFFSSLAERAITAVPVTALPLEAIVTSSAMPRFHQAESNNKRKQNKQQPSKTNNATPTRHKPKTKHLSGN